MLATFEAQNCLWVQLGFEVQFNGNRALQKLGVVSTQFLIWVDEQVPEQSEEFEGDWQFNALHDLRPMADTSWASYPHESRFWQQVVV